MDDMDLILPEEEPKSAKEAAKRAKREAEERAKMQAEALAGARAAAEAREKAKAKAKVKVVEESQPAADTEPEEQPQPVADAEPAKESHSHHHHHHHHHHHSSSSQKRHKKRSKFSRFLLRNKKKVMWVLLAVVLVGMLLVFGLLMDRYVPTKGEPGDDASGAGSITQTVSSIQVEVPLFTEEIPLSVQGVSAYLQSNVQIPASEIFDRHRGEDSVRLDRGLPVTLSYSIKGMPDGYSVRSTQVLLSENSDLSQAKRYTLTGAANKVDVYYLKTGTTYYYRFDLTLSNGTVSGISGTFTTAEGPRILLVDGVFNVRDIGGWATLDNKQIKQGMLYRGTELEGAMDPNYSITTSGVNTMLTEFGIRTDMDLRPASDNINGINALGPNVEHLYYNAPAYVQIFEKNRQESVRAVFADLADASKYPVYLHCTHGLDRTGTICYVLEALLGVAEDDLIREYQLSALHHGSLWTLDELDAFVNQFKSLKGNTMQEKAENYLLSIGVTWDQIASIRTILLEEK